MSNVYFERSPLKDALDALERLMSTVHLDADDCPEAVTELRNFDSHCMTVKDRINAIYILTEQGKS